MNQEERAAEARQGISAAIARYAGGGDTAGAEASPSAVPAPSETMAPLSPEAVPALTPAPEGHGDISRLGTELLAIDPEQAPQIIQSLRQMDEGQFEAAQRRRGVLARSAQYLLSLPADQRTAEFQRIAPELVESGGITRRQLAGFQLTDNNLRFVVAQARDIEKLAEEARPQLRNIGPGEVLIDENNPRAGPIYESPYVRDSAGNVYERGGTEPLPQVATPEEARRLPPGTRFRTPDGRVGTVPGGPTPTASGGFPW